MTTHGTVPATTKTTKKMAGSSSSSSSASSTDSRHLMDAVVRGKIHLTRFILAAATGQVANCWDEEGRTPLIACCDIKEEGTRGQIMQILLDAGADVNKKDREGRCPLVHACEKRCNDIVRLLIHHHKIKPDIEDDFGNTALIYSAAVGNDVATELLTRNFRRLGLQVDHYNRQGNTALLLAIKNGNMNCAKILTQRGRASVCLKDKEHGLTPMEWCLAKGHDKDDIEFLKPNTRFYRVAKLATSLSRSRTSMASLSLEPKSKVSPSKSVDSSRSSKSSKVTLSRSKSESKPSAKGASIFRQFTVDVPGPGRRHLLSKKQPSKAEDSKLPLHASGAKVNECKSGKDDKNKKKGSKRFGPTKNASFAPPVPELETGREANVSKVQDSIGECMNVSTAKMNRKDVPEAPFTSLGVTLPHESDGDHGTAPSNSGRLTGLGCSLSFISVASSFTSLGSWDGPGDVSRPGSQLENVSLCSSVFDVHDHRSTPTSVEEESAETSHSQTTVSFCFDGDTQRAAGGDLAAAEHTGRVPRVTASHMAGGAKPRASHAQRTNAPRHVHGKTPSAACLKRNQSLRDASDPSTLGYEIDETSVSQTGAAAAAACSSGHDPRPPRDLATMAEEEDESLYCVHGAPSGQDARVVSHMCGTCQISQDA